MGEGVRKRPLCYPELSVSVTVCLFSHSRNQFAIRAVTVEQREKEACQVGHTQREMEKDKDRQQGGAVELRRRCSRRAGISCAPPPPAATTPNTPAVIRKIRLSNSLINWSDSRESVWCWSHSAVRWFLLVSFVRKNFPRSRDVVLVVVDEEIKSSPSLD